MIRDIFTYRGKEGYWLWVLHRATGVGIFLFLAIHIVDTLLVFWPSLYDAVTGLYRHRSSAWARSSWSAWSSSTP